MDAPHPAYVSWYGKGGRRRESLMHTPRQANKLAHELLAWLEEQQS